MAVYLDGEIRESRRTGKFTRQERIFPFTL